MATFRNLDYVPVMDEIVNSNTTLAADLRARYAQTMEKLHTLTINRIEPITEETEDKWIKSMFIRFLQDHRNDDECLHMLDRDSGKIILKKDRKV